MSEQSATDHFTAVAQYAREYIAENVPLGAASRIAGVPPEDIEKLLSDPKVQSAVNSIVQDTLLPALKARATSAGKPSMVYMSGALGAKSLLMQASENPTTPELAALKAFRDSSVVADFQDFKQKFAAATGESLEPYGRVRPIMNGINLAVRDAAAAQKLNVLLDDTLAANTTAEDSVSNARLARESKHTDLHVFALTLTPKEAVAQAELLGMDTAEAERTARNFQRNFAALCASVPNVTLLDSKMNVVYEQKDNQVTQRDAAKLRVWETSCAEHVRRL